MFIFRLLLASRLIKKRFSLPFYGFDQPLERSKLLLRNRFQTWIFRKWFIFSDSETGDFVLRADRELQQKEELFITYGGSKSDHVLLAFYGFCLPPGVNRNSYIVFSPNFIGPSSHSKFTAFKFFLNSKKAKCFKESLNKKLESWRKFETAKGFVYALYEEKLCDGFQNTISVLSFLLQKVWLSVNYKMTVLQPEEKILQRLVEMKLRSNEKFINEDNEDIYKVENFILNSWNSKIQ